MESRKKIAIVIPACNEEDNVEIAYERLKDMYRGSQIIYPSFISSRIYKKYIKPNT